MFRNLLPVVLFCYSSAFAADFKNQGGMWLPFQIPEHAETLRSLGLSIAPEELADPTSNLLNSIVHLEFCSGSFISPDGLIITNWHCVEGMLNYLTNDDRSKGISGTNFVKNGFISKNRSEERSVGTTQRILITSGFKDVTAEVLAGVSEIADPALRLKAIDKKVYELVKAAEEGRPNIKVDLKSFYRGTKYYLIERLELKDIRMVFAPPKGLGFFGGDDDNWQYPRHTSDFAVIRAYVAPDGSSASYAPENVPYKAQNYLTVSAKEVNPGDLAFVTGFPGSTERLRTSHEIARQVSTVAPLKSSTIEMQTSIYKKIIDEMDRMGANEEMLPKIEKRRMSLMNVYQNRSTALKNLRDIKFLERKQKQESELQAWIAASPERQQKYGDFLGEMKVLFDNYYEHYEKLFALSIFTSQIQLLGSAITINDFAEEKELPDSERSAAYQERVRERIFQGQDALQKSVSTEVDLNIATLLLKDSEPETLTALKAAYAGTRLLNLEERKKLLNATLEEVTADNDPLLVFARSLKPRIDEMERISNTLSGSLISLNSRYLEALKEFRNSPVAPDANGTLRVAFGTVKGYTEPSTGMYKSPFTTVSQMLAKAVKHNFAKDYEVPSEVFQAAEKGAGIYGDPRTGDIPLNFVTDLDITGGNSGSAVLNKNGQLMGLAFDGTSHSLYSDWMMAANNRSIVLDSRYALWLMDKVYHLDHLIGEMRIAAPSCADHLKGIGDINED